MAESCIIFQMVVSLDIHSYKSELGKDNLKLWDQWFELLFIGERILNVFLKFPLAYVDILNVFLKFTLAYVDRNQ